MAKTNISYTLEWDSPVEVYVCWVERNGEHAGFFHVSKEIGDDKKRLEKVIAEHYG